MKRILSLCICLALAATMLLSGSIALAEGTTTPTRGGTLIAAETLKWSTFCPPKTTNRQGDLHILMQIYEPLIRSDESGNLSPCLALTWESSDNGQTITMKLRDDVFFHDGTKFNAEAVKYVMDWYRTPDLNPIFANEIAELESVEVVEEYVVRFRLSAPSSTFLSALAEYAGLMISPTAIETYGVDALSTTVTCGTGPFILKEAVEGDHVTLARNEQYYLMGEDGQPLPYLDEVIIKIIPDDTVKATNILSGDIQLCNTLNISSQYMLATAEDAELFQAPSGQVYDMMFNMNLEKWQNPLVRQAFSHAINKQEIVDALAKDVGYLTPFFVGTSQWFYSDYEPYPYNPELAREKLAEAGYPNGEGMFKITLTNIAREPDNTLVQLIQAQLKEVLNVDVEIQTLDRLAWVDLWRNTNECDMGCAIITIPRVDPFTQYNVLGRGMSTNYPHYNSDAYNETLAKVKSSYDASEQLEYLHAAQKIALDDCPFVTLYCNPEIHAKSNSLHDVALGKEGYWVLRDAWLEQ